MEYQHLKSKAKEIRKSVIEMASKYGDAHYGGEFSEIEILTSLYYEVMKPEDKFILSKGHACHPLYAILRDKGYNPKIAGHPDMDVENGLSCTTGSLGHGLPLGIGMALARKKLGKSGRIYVLMGDGECQEGTTWESALIASHHKLDNLTVIIDRNELQALDATKKILDLGDLAKKFDAFGCYVREANGHSFESLIPALKPYSQPLFLIAKTVKGKGVSFMEHDPKWHARGFNQAEQEKALEELK